MAQWLVSDVKCVVDLHLDEVASPAVGRKMTDLILVNQEFFCLPRPSWREVEQWLTEEEEFVREYDSTGNGNELLYRCDEIRYEDDRRAAVFDLGITAAVTCVAALGAMPIVSCSGGFPDSPHRESHPLVGFFADQPTLVTLTDLAREQGIGLGNTDPNAALLYARSIPQMLAFTRHLFDRRNELFPRKIKRR